MYVVAMSSLKRNNVPFSNGDNIRVIVAENWSASEITNMEHQKIELVENYQIMAQKRIDDCNLQLNLFNTNLFK